MRLRRLTAIGLTKFSEYLISLKSDPARPVPFDLLEASEFSEPIGQPTDIDLRPFSTRLEIATHIDIVLSNAQIHNAGRDVGLGAWLSLFYFDVLCPINQTRVRKVREMPAYIPEPENYRRYYRHLIFGSLLIYRAHRDDPSRAMGYLCKPPHIIDDVVGQLAATQDFVQSQTMTELVTRLYYDSNSKTTKRGASSKGAGSPRRLADVLNQFDLTWDLYATPVQEYLTLLPKEFGRFIAA